MHEVDNTDDGVEDSFEIYVHSNNEEFYGRVAIVISPDDTVASVIADYCSLTVHWIRFFHFCLHL